MNYWEKRLLERSSNLYDSSSIYLDELFELYTNTTNDINRRIYELLNGMNEISIADAKTLLNDTEIRAFKDDLKSFRKASKGNLTKELERELDIVSRRVRISYLQAMETQIKARTFELMSKEEGLLFNYLVDSYDSHYMAILYELREFTGYKQINAINNNLIKAIIEKPWAEDGKNFSSRIWDRRDKLVTALNNELKTGIVTGRNPNEIIKSITNQFDTSKANAKRLVITENTAIQANANKMAFESMGVDRYEISITLDSRTSDICQHLENKVFKMKDYKVGVTAPPFHPYCRSVAIPFFDDDIQKEIEQNVMARDKDGKSVKVKNMTYEEWREWVNNNKSTELLKEIKSEYNLQINGGRQGKHILHHNNYEGKGYLLEHIDPQKLADETIGTGVLKYTKDGKWTNKEFVQYKDYIGYNIDIDGTKNLTKRFCIHYSKKNGIHISPRKEE